MRKTHSLQNFFIVPWKLLYIAAPWLPAQGQSAQVDTFLSLLRGENK